MSKMISFRMDESIIRELDKMLESYPQFDRSAVLRRLIETFVKCMSSEARWKLLSSYDPYSDGLQLEVGQVSKK